MVVAAPAAVGVVHVVGSMKQHVAAVVVVIVVVVVVVFD